MNIPCGFITLSSLWQRLTGFRKNLSLLSTGSGQAFVEAYPSKFMGFKCTAIDLHDAINTYKHYCDWAGFKSVGINIDSYVRESDRKFDVIMSLENIEHIHAAPSEYIAKFAGSLAPEGYFIISTPDMGSFAHLFIILMMMPTLPVPEQTFDLSSYVHYVKNTLL